MLLEPYIILKIKNEMNANVVSTAYGLVALHLRSYSVPEHCGVDTCLSLYGLQFWQAAAQ